jgi:putative ATP-dependent endonuclease of OLD family
LQRADDTIMPIPVALVPDRDLPPNAAKALVGERLTEGEWEQGSKDAHIANLSKDAGGCVRVFPSEQWTLEYDIARKRDCAILIHQAICLARGQRGRTRDQIKVDAVAEVLALQADNAKTDETIAVEIFAPLAKSGLSKAEVAEQLARLIDEIADTPEVFRRKLPSYLVDAIDYATGAPPPAAPVPPAQGPAPPNAPADGEALA